MLGGTYHGLGEYEEAEQQYRRAWEIRERVLGPEDLATLNSMNGLANAILREGRDVEAEAMHR